jgi:hypothetical protein
MPALEGKGFSFDIDPRNRLRLLMDGLIELF